MRTKTNHETFLTERASKLYPISTNHMSRRDKKPILNNKYAQEIWYDFNTVLFSVPEGTSRR